MMKDINFEKLYFERFDKENNIKIRISLWKVLCKNFFQQFVNIQDITLDLGAGYCEFINNIKCKEKYAVDLNEKIKTFASPEVKTIIKNVSDMSVFPENFFNIIFISNF
ncbi:MAG: methyltransferase, partial [Cyanobacteria bacterium]|nr:methyltransferase [Cyanobacteriota bacterium]